MGKFGRPEDIANAMILAVRDIIYQLEHPPLKGITLNNQELFNKELLSVNDEEYLEKIYPNTFSETLYIQFNAESESGEDVFVDIRIYNFSGQLVKVLTSTNMPEGDYLMEWDGKYDNGQMAQEALYFIEFKVGEYRTVKPLVYQK